MSRHVIIYLTLLLKFVVIKSDSSSSSSVITCENEADKEIIKITDRNVLYDIDNCLNSELNLENYEYATNLTYLKAMRNLITKLDGSSFHGATNLKIIDLRYFNF